MTDAKPVVLLLAFCEDRVQDSFLFWAVRPNGTPYCTDNDNFFEEYEVRFIAGSDSARTAFYDGPVQDDLQGYLQLVQDESRLDKWLALDTLKKKKMTGQGLPSFAFDSDAIRKGTFKKYVQHQILTGGMDLHDLCDHFNYDSYKKECESIEEVEIDGETYTVYTG